MPLSEHEQRLLEEMERNLYNNDADFVAKVGRGGRQVSYRMIVLGVLVVVVGLFLLVTGVFLKNSVVGVVGFVCMFGGVLLMMTPNKSRSAGRGKSAQGSQGGPDAHSFGGRPASSGKKSGFMERMNARWEKRQEK